MLESLGVTPRAEQVYRALLQAGPATVPDLAGLVAADTTTIAAALEDLRGLRLASPEEGGAGCWHAESPEVTLASLVVQQQETLLERQRELDRVQRTVADLVRLSRGRGLRASVGVVEPVADADAIRRRCRHLARTVERCVMSIDKPSCRPGRGAPDTSEGDDHLAMLGRGVEIQSLYERPALLEPGRFEELRRLVAAGEQARTTPSLPMRVVIFDEVAAVVHLDEPSGSVAPSALFVHPSELLTGLLVLFELLWERAVPVPPTRDEEPDAMAGVDEVLLALLAAGFKDESIARHLGISASTVTRRMARLMEQTGTSTRFQLGMQAVRQGWI